MDAKSNIESMRPCGVWCAVLYMLTRMLLFVTLLSLSLSPIMGISAQTSDIDYSSLALVREDLPAVIKGDLRVTETDHNPDFDGTYWPDVTGLRHHYFTDVKQILKAKYFALVEGQWKLWWLLDYSGLDGVGVLYVFEDEANAASHYRSRASQYTISSGILSGSARTLLSSTYGDESVGCMAVLGRGLESPGRKYIVLMFRFEHIIAKLKLGWYDDVPLEFFAERKDEMFSKRKIVFQDDPNVKDAGPIIAENWSERLKKEIGLPPPPVEQVATLDVYPTESNFTTIEIDNTGQDLKSRIKFGVKDELPPGLLVKFDPEEVEPSASGRSTVKVNVTLDYFSNSKEEKPLPLPSDYNLNITATSGDFKVTKVLPLRLLKAKWLVMLYFAMDTDPDIQENMYNNFNELLVASNAYGTPKVGIIVLIDFRNDKVVTNNLKFQGDTGYRLQILRNNIVKPSGKLGGPPVEVPVIEKVNMGYWTTLSNFILYSCNAIPADRIHLVMAGHGSANLLSVCPDFHQKGILEIVKMDSALTPKKGFKKCDVISFDACEMAIVESLYQLRQRTNYLTCSELEIPGGGYNYVEFLGGLMQNPEIGTLDYAKSIVESYKNRYSSKMNDTTLSAIDSSKLDDLASKMDLLGKELIKVLGNDNYENLGHVLIAIDNLKSSDIADFAQKIADDPVMPEDVKKAARDVVKAVDVAVVANYEHLTSARAVRYYGLLAGYERGAYNFNKDTSWDNFYYEKQVAEERYFVHESEKLGLQNPFVRAKIEITHSEKQLYLHIYDSKGSHVGFNPTLMNISRRQLDMQIPNAQYIDYMNGTKVVILPRNITDFRTVVDGSRMEEEEESYALTYTLLEGDKVIFTEKVEKTIKYNTAHSIPIKTQDGKLTIGETNVTAPPYPPPTTEPPPKPPLTLTYEYAVFVVVIMFVVVAVYLRKRSKSQPAKLVQAPLQPQPPQYMRQPSAELPPRETTRPSLQIQRPEEEKISCPNCEAINLLDSEFCGKCGGTLQQMRVFCEECGRRILASSAYCKYCGDKQRVA